MLVEHRANQKLEMLGRMKYQKYFLKIFEKEDDGSMCGTVCLIHLAFQPAANSVTLVVRRGYQFLSRFLSFLFMRDGSRAEKALPGA